MAEQDPQNDDGWAEWRRHVLAELRRFNKGQDALYARVGTLEVGVGKLKVRANGWSAVSGAIAALLVLLLAYLKG